jgi:hypothetical protein
MATHAVRATSDLQSAWLEGFKLNHHPSTTQQHPKHKAAANRDLWVITMVTMAAAKTITSGIRAIGIRMSIYNAAIDHNDNMAIANHIRLSAIVLIKRTQTGRATRACTLLLSKGPTFPLSRSTRRAYPSGTQVTLVDGELMNLIARY